MAYITLDFTPNPSTLKYVTDGKFSDRVYNFKSIEGVEHRSNVWELLSTPGVTAVMVGPSFVTVTRGDDSDIERLHEAVMFVLNHWIASGEVLTLPEEGKRDLSALDQKIADFIRDDVQPAVAQDGGNVIFEKFEDGVVYLTLEGSCAGCPSSTMTLKMGIERRLKEIVPEVTEVVSI